MANPPFGYFDPVLVHLSHTPNKAATVAQRHRPLGEFIEIGFAFDVRFDLSFDEFDIATVVALQFLQISPASSHGKFIDKRRFL